MALKYAKDLVLLLIVICAVTSFLEILSSATKQDRTPENKEIQNTLLGGFSEIPQNTLPNVRRKRAFNYRASRWPNKKIGFVFNESFTDPSRKQVVRLAMKFISDHTCLNLVDETAGYDSEDKNWFSEHGYGTNSFVLLIPDSGCATYTVGGPKDSGGAIDMAPCKQFRTVVHEMLHVFGIAHSQLANDSDKYISVFMDNIKPDTQNQYQQSSTTASEYFDYKSTMLYSDGTFSRNGEVTYDLMRPEYRLPEVASQEEISFKEINDFYDKEDCCKKNYVDCSPGHLGIIKKKCRCICPSERDHNTNCKTLINGPDLSLRWPTPFGVFAAGPDFSCPDGFQLTGWINFCGTQSSYQGYSPYPFPQSGSTTSIPVCSNPKGRVNWQDMPIGGKYCVIKPIGIDCDFPYNLYTINATSSCPIQYNGSIGDITINDNNLTLRYCCRELERNTYEMELPNAKCFRLHEVSMDECPIIKGMTSISHELTLYTDNPQGKGDPATPDLGLFQHQLGLYHCTYCPPVYGCNQNVTLNSSTKAVTVITPGYPEARPPNTRCIFNFNVPAGAKVLVTFNDFDVYDADKVFYKNMKPINEPNKIDNKNPPNQIISEGPYMVVEFWSAFQNASNKGLNFTATVLLAEEACYDVLTKGANYLGNMNVSEYNEPCLPWKDTLDCYYSPENPWDRILGYFEGNSCRNPGGRLLQPWCFVYKNGTNCAKRYCDVCNYKDPTDSVPTSNCTSAIRADPTFCSTTIQRYSCAKSCNMPRASTVKTSCGQPPIPSDGVLVGKTKSAYYVGDRVYVQCKYLPIETSSVMMCKKDGWTILLGACTDCPKDWFPYEDRCVYINVTRTLYQDALNTCSELEDSGTLFQIKKEEDLVFIRKARMSVPGSSVNDQTFVSGSLYNESKWVFTDTNIPMTYFNWSSSGSSTNPPKGMYIYREYSSSGRNGGMNAISPDTSTRYSFACQINKLPVTNDRVSTCQASLSSNPNFCTETRSSNIAQSQCFRSCGKTAETQNCSTPKSANYTRTSTNEIIKAGEVMTFACKPGYILFAGDLTRACGVNGKLLGVEPTCLTDPPFVDIAHFLLRERSSTLKPGLIVALDFDGYRVPCPGKITVWYSYCKSSGPIYFLVYRKRRTTYNLKGYNLFTCQPGRLWSYKVPAADQISVERDDIYGVYTTEKDILYWVNNDDFDEKPLLTKTAAASTFEDVQTITDLHHTNFTVPSASYRVEC